MAMSGQELQQGMVAERLPDIGLGMASRCLVQRPGCTACVCVRVCVCACMCVCVCAHASACLRLWQHVHLEEFHMLPQTLARTCVHTHAHTHTHARTHAHTHMHASTRVPTFR